MSMAVSPMGSPVNLFKNIVIWGRKFQYFDFLFFNFKHVAVWYFMYLCEG